MTWIFSQAKSFCNLHHCVLKIAYMPCFEEYEVKIKKVVEEPAGEIMAGVTAIGILQEKEIEIGRSQNKSIELAISSALGVARTSDILNFKGYVLEAE